MGVGANVGALADNSGRVIFGVQSEYMSQFRFRTENWMKKENINNVIACDLNAFAVEIQQLTIS